MALCSHEGIAQCLGYVGGYQAGLAGSFGCDVARQAVDVSAEDCGVEIAQALACKCGYYAGQDVAGAGGCHAGVAGLVDVDALAVGDYGSGALQDYDGSALLS